MPGKVRFNAKDNLIEIHAWGEVTDSEILRSQGEVERLYQESKTTRVLFDTEAVEALPSPYMLYEFVVSLLDVRNPADTIFVQNCTLYNSGGTIRGRDNLLNNVILDHNTFYQPSRSGGSHTLRLGRTINLTMTNNLIIDMGFRGEVRGAGTPDSVWKSSECRRSNPCPLHD